MKDLLPSRIATLALLFLTAATVAAQKTGGKPGSIPAPPPITNNIPDTNSTMQLRPLYVSGSVILQGGMALTEPVAIERVCNGSAHREGYSDFRGQFQIQLGSSSNTQFQDVTENNSSQNTDSLTQKMNQTNLTKYEGCELRAVLAGFQSSSVPLHITDDFGQVKVGNIVLTKMGNVEGATISLTSMSAPGPARQAYEKGRKAVGEKKYEEAEKHLNKAVELYPRYASAWYLLGEVHRFREQRDEAASDYNASVRADPEYVSPYFGLALLALDQKHWEEAERMTAQVTRLNGLAYPSAYFYNAAANFNLGKMEAAEQSARKFQSLDTTHQIPDVSLLLASILQAKQDYAGAARQLRAYLEQVPNSPRAAELRGQAEKLESQGAVGQN